MPTDIPIAQANKPAVIATVVNAIAHDCVTSTEIAHAIGMVGRQGAYYPNAAALLGYVEAIAHSSPTEWQLTDLGVELLALNADEKAANLSDAILALDDIQLLDMDGGRALLEEQFQSLLGGSTTTRRLVTYDSWLTWAKSNATDRSSELAAAVNGTVKRAPGVRAARKPTPNVAPRVVCPTCHMEIARSRTTCESCE